MPLYTEPIAEKNNAEAKASTPPPKYLLVYGSLMRCADTGNSEILEGATLVGYGHTQGGLGHGYSHLRMFDRGKFPYVCRDNTQYGYLIWGELYTDIPQDTWDIIKEMEEYAGYGLEDVGGFYHYQGNRWINGAKAWIYNSLQHARTFTEVQSGSWRNLAMQGGQA